MNPILFGAFLYLLGGTKPVRQAPPATVQAFVGARILPISGPPIEAGVLLVQNGKVLGVGGANLPIPAGAVVVHLEGKTILPGLVDTHSHIAGPAGADG